MNMSKGRIGAVIRKELTEFRRSRNIMYTMAILPAVFLVAPTISLLSQSPSAPSAGLTKGVGFFLVYLLLIPAIVPSTIAGYSVAGEREQGTLEPILTTPVRREEFLVGKAVATLIPAVGVAYLVLGAFLVIVRLGANAVMASAVLHSPELIADIFFIPLLAAWAIWIGLAISSRASDIRVAQQLGTLASLPPVGLTLLLSFHVISSTIVLAVSLAGVLLAIDCGAYLLVSKLFDRERLITDIKPGTA